MHWGLHYIGALRAVLLKESDSNRNLRSAACRTRIHISGRYIYTSEEITFFIRALYSQTLYLGVWRLQKRRDTRTSIQLFCF
jgi:hypothetical protein